MPPWMKLVTAVVLAEVTLGRDDIARAERWTTWGKRNLMIWEDAGIVRSRLERLTQIINERRMTEPLTARERLLLELLTTYLTQREISTRLHVSQNTLKTHTRALFRKLDVHSRSEAVNRAERLGLLSN